MVSKVTVLLEYFDSQSSIVLKDYPFSPHIHALITCGVPNVRVTGSGFVFVVLYARVIHPHSRTLLNSEQQEVHQTQKHLEVR